MDNIENFNDEPIYIPISNGCEISFDISSRGNQINLFLVQGSITNPTEYFISEDSLDAHIKALQKAQRKILLYRSVILK